jgi:hypothetical protein
MVSDFARSALPLLSRDESQFIASWIEAKLARCEVDGRHVNLVRALFELTMLGPSAALYEFMHRISLETDDQILVTIILGLSRWSESAPIMEHCPPRFLLVCLLNSGEVQRQIIQILLRCPFVDLEPGNSEPIFLGLVESAIRTSVLLGDIDRCLIELTRRLIVEARLDPQAILERLAWEIPGFAVCLELVLGILGNDWSEEEWERASALLALRGEPVLEEVRNYLIGR